MSYLFWAHVVFWVALFIYVYSLIRKNQGLRREIDALKNSLRDSREGGVIWQKQGVK